jgi:hypothetical protein
MALTPTAVAVVPNVDDKQRPLNSQKLFSLH